MRKIAFLVTFCIALVPFLGFPVRFEEWMVFVGALFIMLALYINRTQRDSGGPQDGSRTSESLNADSASPKPVKTRKKDSMPTPVFSEGMSQDMQKSDTHKNGV